MNSCCPPIPIYISVSQVNYPVSALGIIGLHSTGQHDVSFHSRQLRRAHEWAAMPSAGSVVMSKRTGSCHVLPHCCPETGTSFYLQLEIWGVLILLSSGVEVSQTAAHPDAAPPNQNHSCSTAVEHLVRVHGLPRQASPLLCMIRLSRLPSRNPG